MRVRLATEFREPSPHIRRISNLGKDLKPHELNVYWMRVVGEIDQLPDLSRPAPEVIGRIYGDWRRVRQVRKSERRGT